MKHPPDSVKRPLLPGQVNVFSIFWKEGGMEGGKKKGREERREEGIKERINGGQERADFPAYQEYTTSSS